MNNQTIQVFELKFGKDVILLPRHDLNGLSAFCNIVLPGIMKGVITQTSINLLTRLMTGNSWVMTAKDWLKISSTLVYKDDGMTHGETFNRVLTRSKIKATHVNIKKTKSETETESVVDTGYEEEIIKKLQQKGNSKKKREEDEREEVDLANKFQNLNINYKDIGNQSQPEYLSCEEEYCPNEDTLNKRVLASTIPTKEQKDILKGCIIIGGTSAASFILYLIIFIVATEVQVLIGENVDKCVESQYKSLVKTESINYEEFNKQLSSIETDGLMIKDFFADVSDYFPWNERGCPRFLTRTVNGNVQSNKIYKTCADVRYAFNTYEHREAFNKVKQKRSPEHMTAHIRKAFTSAKNLQQFIDRSITSTHTSEDYLYVADILSEIQGEMIDDKTVTRDYLLSTAKDQLKGYVDQLMVDEMYKDYVKPLRRLFPIKFTDEISNESSNDDLYEHVLVSIAYFMYSICGLGAENMKRSIRGKIKKQGVSDFPEFDTGFLVNSWFKSSMWLMNISVALYMLYAKVSRKTTFTDKDEYYYNPIIFPFSTKLTNKFTDVALKMILNFDYSDTFIGKVKQTELQVEAFNYNNAHNNNAWAGKFLNLTTSTMLFLQNSVIIWYALSINNLWDIPQFAAFLNSFGLKNPKTVLTKDTGKFFMYCFQLFKIEGNVGEGLLKLVKMYFESNDQTTISNG